MTMDVTPVTYLIVLPLIFAAGLIDAVAGGGGLISLPAYYAAGLPPYLAAGTNKFSAACGTAVATSKYLASGNVRLKAAVPAAMAALPGAYLGARLLLFVPEDAVRAAVLVLIPLAGIFVLFIGRKEAAREERICIPLCAVIGLVIGAYDGFFGPGTGTFLMLLFMSLCRMQAVAAGGSARVVNLASNAASLATFMFAGQVLWAVALPAALANMAGGYIGSRMAVKRGAAVIKPALIVALAMLLIKILYDIIM